MTTRIATLIVAILGLFLVNSATYTLPEHEQALILQLGKIQGEPITKAGLHFKLPFVQEVRYFEKRILQWDGVRGEIPTLDKKFIWVDTTARWQITDAVKFFKTVREPQNALLRMGAVLDGVTRDTVSAFDLIEVVRTSNDIVSDLAENVAVLDRQMRQEGESTFLQEDVVDVAQVIHGREKISQMIAERAGKELENFGIHLIDIQMRSIAYKEVVEKKVYARMISEQEKIATKIRSSGKGEEAKILGKLDLTLKRIESEAYRSSQELRGKAEAEAILVYAKTLQADPDYFEFVKTLEVYRKTLGKKAEFLLSTDNEFLKILNQGS